MNKLIALDMDGVINSNHHRMLWTSNKYDQLKSQIEDLDLLRKAVIDSYKIEFCHGHELVIPELAAKITEICDITEAKILWTSTWRTLPEYEDISKARQMFNRRGLPGDRLIGYTPKLGADYIYGNHTRSEQINLWLKNNQYGYIDRCAVIDDRSDAGYQLVDNAKFFQTTFERGITDQIVDSVIKYLNG